MISLKSPREISLMKEAGRITALVLRDIEAYIKPGISTGELDKIAEEIILKAGALPSFKGLYDFPSAACISVNEELVHGIPSFKRILKEGDIVSIDVGANYKGYHGDSAWTYPVGEISEAAKDLLVVTENALYEGLKQVKAGVHLSDVSHAIGEYAYSHGYTVPLDYTGHGIGAEIHEEPIIPNFGAPKRGPILKAGMTLAIEPMLHQGKPFTEVLSDDWTVVTKDRKLSAHYEHTVLVTEIGYQILTQVKEGND